MGHFLWCPEVDAYASYTEIIKFSEKEGIGYGLYAADSRSIMNDYFLLAAVQNSWINFRSQHKADIRNQSGDRSIFPGRRLILGFWFTTSFE
jgi:hypothetical protein